MLIISDRPGWVFHNFGLACQRWCRDFDVDIHHLSESGLCIPHRDYHALLWLVDVRTDKLLKVKLPRNKTIYAVRSDVFRSRAAAILHKKVLKSLAVLVLAPNTNMLHRLRSYHPNVKLFPGGVDHTFFRPAIHQFHNPPVVGWAGSTAHFNARVRGLHQAAAACKAANMTWFPALKEKQARSHSAMPSYYACIDIYLDLSSTAGRQNGLLEAAACGRLCFAADTGIASSLIDHGRTGYIVTRKNAGEMLRRYGKYSPKMQADLVKEVTKNWTWQVQAAQLSKYVKEAIPS